MPARERRFIAVGQIVKPHGVRGEVVVEVLTDYPGRFALLETVYLNEKDPQPVPLENVRFHKERVLLKLGGCDDRTAAEKLRGEMILIPFSEAMPLEADQYYQDDLIGLQVWTTDEEHLGEVVEILETGANEVFIVHGGRGEVLLPAIPDVIREIDLEAKRMVVELMEGLI
ncbi:MAG: 16S rRNA processing protein RimM [Chloroflexi bacterium]|nr:MAG: 16S rRNA processing protein RimM [Chloroflexota bacterium]